jgi:hypothetical protein
LDVTERQQFPAVRSSDFPHSAFFQHLSSGTTFFHNKNYAKAIGEWQEAAKLRPDFVGMKVVSDAPLFRSSLDEVPLLGLLYILFSSAHTGVAAVRSTIAHKEVVFKQGWIVFARTTKAEERLGTFLHQRDLRASFNLEEVVIQAKESKEKLGTFLVKGGLLREKELFELLDFQVKEILADLFSWQEGDFYFEAQEVAEEDVVVSYTPLDVALFAARRALDFTTSRKMIPNNKIIFHIPPYIEGDRKNVLDELDANERFIFLLIDGNKNVDHLIKLSGDDEVSVVNILYRLESKGLIKKTKGVGTYDDAEHREVAIFVKTFLEVFRLVLEQLRKELGTKAKGIVDRALEELTGDYKKFFNGVTMYTNLSSDEQKILKNIFQYYPHPSDNLIFIDGFYALITNILHAMATILGIPLTKQVIAEIRKIKGDISRFYTDSPMKGRVLETFDKIVAQYPR